MRIVSHLKKMCRITNLLYFILNDFLFTFIKLLMTVVLYIKDEKLSDSGDDKDDMEIWQSSNSTWGQFRQDILDCMSEEYISKRMEEEFFKLEAEIKRKTDKYP